MQETIRRILEERFRPEALEVIDDSARHAGHREAGAAKNSHFEVKITAASFAGKSRLERQRMINAALKPCFDQGMHALAIAARAPGE